MQACAAIEAEDGHVEEEPAPAAFPWSQNTAQVVYEAAEQELEARPAQSPFSASVCAARTLNTTGPSRVTLSLQQEHF